MLTPTLVILSLKYAVGAVTLLLCISLIALANGKVQLHGKINVVFFVLTLATLFLFEIVVDVVLVVVDVGLGVAVLAASAFPRWKPMATSTI